MNIQYLVTEDLVVMTVDMFLEINESLHEDREPELLAISELTPSTTYKDLLGIARSTTGARHLANQYVNLTTG